MDCANDRPIPAKQRVEKRKMSSVFLLLGPIDVERSITTPRAPFRSDSNKCNKKKSIQRVCFHFEVQRRREKRSGARRRGGLSHLTAVGLMLIHTQTRRRGGLPRAFRKISRAKLFKEGIILNIRQYLVLFVNVFTSEPPPPRPSSPSLGEAPRDEA